MTQRSGISGIGFKHIPSAVGRHFGESCMVPPFIVPVPSAKRTREVLRPSSISICQGRPSATLAANDILRPDSRADTAVICSVTPAIIKNTQVALARKPEFGLGDDKRAIGPGVTAAHSFALMTMTRDEPIVRPSASSRLVIRRGLYCRHRDYCDDDPEKRSDCHRSDGPYLEWSASLDENAECDGDESRQ